MLHVFTNKRAIQRCTWKSKKFNIWLMRWTFCDNKCWKMQINRYFGWNESESFEELLGFKKLICIRKHPEVGAKIFEYSEKNVWKEHLWEIRKGQSNRSDQHGSAEWICKNKRCTNQIEDFRDNFLDVKHHFRFQR